jgi:apolipoprotein N-acyltransferase
MEERNFNLNNLVSLGFLILFFIALIFVARGVFYILSLAAPVLLLGALLINYKVVVGYGKFVLRLLKERTLTGIIAVILTILGFPIVSAFLFAKAIFKRKVSSLQDQIKKEQEGLFTEYEEIQEEVLELPELKKEKLPNEYEELFDDDLP